MPEVLRILLIALCWVAIHIGSGYAAHHMPLRWFEGESWLFRERRWERGGNVYRTVFGIHRWKHLLPEAGSMFSGGFDKSSLSEISDDYMKRFEAETRRAEFSHWLPLPVSAIFFLWNPVEIAVWMPVYAILTNTPFIVIQRFVRPRLARISKKRAKRGLTHIAGSRTGPENPKDGFEPEIPSNDERLKRVRDDREKYNTHQTESGE